MALEFAFCASRGDVERTMKKNKSPNLGFITKIVLRVAIKLQLKNDCSFIKRV